MKKSNKKAYSIIVSVLMIGFLMVVTAGVFNLVLLEMNDTRGNSNYLKAYAAAEGAGELALLKIKQEGYAYVDKIEDSVNNRSIILAEAPLDKNSFNKNKYPYISYDFDYTVNSFSGNLASAGYDIIPLFYLDDSGEHKVTSITLQITSGNTNKLAWNIVGEESGISGLGKISSSTEGEGRKQDGTYFNENVGDFLSSSNTNYLILFNIDSDNIGYSLKTDNSNEYFTKPRTDIITSAQIGKYRQNLKIHLDNTEFLNILKYSIYGN